MLPFALELGRPLLAALVFAGGLALLARAGVRARHAPRLLFLLAVALAAGDLRVRDPDPPRLRVFVVDRSRSFENAARSVAATLEIGTRDLDAARDTVAVIAFAASPRVVLEPAPPGEIREGARRALAESLDASSTDVGAALDLALDVARSRPATAEVVLVTDGHDTAGRAREAAGLLAASGMALHAVAPIAAPLPNARVADVRAPARVGVGVAARVEVDLESSVAGRVRTTIETDARVTGAASIVDAAEAFSPLHRTFVVTPERAGLVRARVRVELLDARDEFPDDDEREVAFLAGDRSRAVLVGPGDAWSAVLEAAGFEVERMAPETVGAALVEGTRPLPDLVVLDEVPASAAPLDALKKQLESGGGLVVAGDLEAFGPGGYAGSDLEALLPVRSGPPDSRAKPLALEVVLDASGSMGTTVADKQSRYSEAVKDVIPATRELRAGDGLGVVTFAGEPRVLPPVERTEDLRATLQGTEPEGTTNIGKAVEAGLDELAKREGRRLLILVTDGEDETVDPHLGAIHDKAAALGDDFEAALVGIGSESRATLEKLVKAIGPKHARFYAVAEAGDELAKLVRGDIVRGSRQERRVGLFRTVDGPGHAGFEVGSYTPVRPKEAARTEISLVDPERELPAALAVTSEHVLALATDLGEGGAVLARAGRGRILELVRRVARKDPGDLELRAERAPGWLTVVAHTSRTGLTAALGDERVSFRPTAPGELLARLPAPRGAALVRVLRGDEPLGAIAVPAESSLELAPPARDLDLLEALVAPSGGTVLPEIGPLPRLVSKETVRRRLAGDLALAALALLVLEGGISVLLERLAAARAARRAFTDS